MSDRLVLLHQRVCRNLPRCAALPAGVVLTLALISGHCRAGTADLAKLRLPDTQAELQAALVSVEFEGDDQPAAVLAWLDHVPAPQGVPDAVWQRLRWRTKGSVAARSGLSEEVQRAHKSLLAIMSDGQPDGLATADALMVLAQASEHQGRSDDALLNARRAAEAYQRYCAGTQHRADCDHRSLWRVLRMQASRAEARGARIEAIDFQQRSIDLAVRHTDALLHAFSLSSLALLHQIQGDPVLAQREMAQAEGLARQEGPLAISRVRVAQSRLASLKGDEDAARRHLEEALAQARAAGTERQMAMIRVNLADALMRSGRPREALLAIEQALPVLRRVGDVRSEPVLLHNGGLARLALGQVAAGRADLESALRLWQAAGAWGRMQEALHEHSEALAARGEVHASLDLYHREQALREQIQQSNRDALLKQLREQQQAQAEQRELELLARDNALKATQLDNQSLLYRVWALGVLLLVLASAAVGVLVSRAREANRALRRSEVQLKLQSERDPLTGLANRRHLRDMLKARANGLPRFDGALLLLDLDHFKRVNDRHGHNAGDAVLVEVAHRLGKAVREADLVCRWGGEEFLVFAPHLHGEALDAMAQRLLDAISAEPVLLPDGSSLQVTGSLGYAAFPLPPHQVAVGWEQALNLVDLALFIGKDAGRDRRVCIRDCQARTTSELAQIEQDVAAARARGQVTMDVLSRV